MPLFSVIVPIYKVEAYLERCINSILSQTFKNFELILVDDGSPDTCPKLCDRLSKSDRRSSVIHKKNGGLSSARNAGIAKASGDYLIFVDSDDEIKNTDAFENIANRINKFQEDVIQYVCEDYYLDKKFSIVSRGNFNLNIFNQGSKELTISYLSDHKMIPSAAWNICVKKKIVDTYNILFPLNVVGEDYVWILKVLYYCKSIGAVNNAVYRYYRGVPGSITTHIKVSGLWGMNLAFDFWRSKSDWPIGIVNHMSYVYLILLNAYALLSKENKQNVYEMVKNNQIVLKKASCFKYKVLYVFCQLFGFEILANLINFVKRKIL